MSETVRRIGGSPPQAIEEFPPGDPVDVALKLEECLDRRLAVDLIHIGAQNVRERVTRDEEIHRAEFCEPGKLDAIALRHPLALTELESHARLCHCRSPHLEQEPCAIRCPERDYQLDRRYDQIRRSEPSPIG